MPMIIKMEYSKAWNLKKSEFNTITRAAYGRIGIEWQKEMLPLHFEEGAAERYKYRKRTKKTQKAKESASLEGLFFKSRDEDAHLPLIWTGSSRSGSGTGKVTGTANGVKVTVPRGNWNFHPWQGREVTAVTKGEFNQLMKMFDDAVTRAIKRLQTQKGTR